jgi:hypothetical protein
MNKDEKIQKVLEGLTREAADKAKVIEFGWVVFKRSIPATASLFYISEMRNAFFAGAQHLFASIMTFLDSGEDATQADLDRMSRIAKELSDFVDEYKRDNLQ